MADATVVKEYENSKDYNKDAKKMSKDGYSVLSVTERTNQRGIVKRAVPFVKDNKYTLVVTYVKQPSS